MGAFTSVEISCFSGDSLTFLSSASLAVIQLKILVLFEVSVASQALKLGSPTFASASGFLIEMVPSTISLRYTDVTPGNDGDSISSSTRTIFRRSRLTLFGSIFMNPFRIRSAVWRVFSYGSFFVPGRRLVSRCRPSGNFSSVSMIMRFSGSLGLCRTSTTRSQTRTSFLCSAASNIRRAAPLSTSWPIWGNVLALPTPNLLMSILCSFNILSNVSRLNPAPFKSVDDDTSSISWMFARLALSLSHHS
mmetsp:Transcript_88180/g.249702  ORF Transcript_88180/g.249702 Transcript_88180/m.249702 type:complete len:248 (-) Transcript_88180:1104-1847(-)